MRSSDTYIHSAKSFAFLLGRRDWHLPTREKSFSSMIPHTEPQLRNTREPLCHRNLRQRGAPFHDGWPFAEHSSNYCTVLEHRYRTPHAFLIMMFAYFDGCNVQRLGRNVVCATTWTWPFLVKIPESIYLLIYLDIQLGLNRTCSRCTSA
ncbi:unnamed protein product [Tuber melanosporum]|uniref:(Perigord truffle) hypothetical protein n=1 Tax=Tuber melanosporum (strain Mel28) TaxID=656061 RepID=D5GF64_TUBMM|nr:uncharacterized protein GSTUM_00006744001 [Tuber melanosporum]CAZ83157.1 unnamed protein product [Tuber melanosporum]